MTAIIATPDLAEMTYDGPIPPEVRDAVRAERHRFAALPRRRQIAEMIAREELRLAQYRHTCLHLLADRRAAWRDVVMAPRHPSAARDGALKEFNLADYDARFHLRWYRSTKQLLAQARAELDALL